MKNSLIVVVILFCIIMIILSMVIAGSPTTFEKWNVNLQKATNIISYFSMVFSIIALLIATFAYRAAIMRPKLRIKIIPWMYEKDDIVLLYNPKTKMIPITKPLTNWEIWLENYGDAAAKYAVVEIKFEGMYFGNETFEGWQKAHHANALGWYGFQWSSNANLIVHPQFPVKLPTMYLQGEQLQGDKLNLIVTIVADGFKRNTVKVPVKLENSDH